MLVRDPSPVNFRRSIGLGVCVALLALTLGRPLAAQATEQRTHTVKRGDTLWDIAKTYLGDAFQWPEIYRLNTEIVENPHWIYPGEVLKIPGEQQQQQPSVAVTAAPPPAAVVTPKAAPAPTRTIFSPPDLSYQQPAAAAASAHAEPQRIVRLGEHVAAPWVDGRGGPRVWGRIMKSDDLAGITAAEQRPKFQLFDRVLIAPPGGAPNRVHDWYLAYRFGPLIEDLGQIIIPTGVVEVVRPGAPGEATVARIVKMFGSVEETQRLIPYDSTPANVVGSTVPVLNGPSGKVKWIYMEPVLPSLQHYVVLDLGERQGLAVGDEIELYQPRERRPEQGQLAAPEISIGQAQVVRVTPFGGTAIITHVEQPKIELGTSARLAAKIP